MVSGETTKFSGCFSFVGTHIIIGFLFRGIIIIQDHVDFGKSLHIVPGPLFLTSVIS